ncbi:MAG TPA: DUF1501 domain-containing protein [Alphaproteobacteria bacterium]|nr:DUF1501 domain-containing protein [Alphaproteobacteria bacterium]
MLQTRRDFLKAAAIAGTIAPLSGVRDLAYGADSSRDKVLVVLFLRGGCDSLNLIGPCNDRNYVEDRIAPLRVLDSGDKPGISLANGLDPAIDFRLHPAAAPLGDLYKQGHLAIVHAVGLSNETRSHFVAQDLIERGAVSDAGDQSTGAKSSTPIESGWLARYAKLVGLDNAGPKAVPVLSASNAVDKSLEGFGAALAIPDLAGGVGLAGGEQARAVLSALYADQPGDIAEAGRLTLAKFATVDAGVPKGPDGKPMPYHPEGGANYDEGGESAGRGLAAIARIIKMDIGLRVASVDMGGWDTHQGQQYRFGVLATQLGRNIAAFWNDLAAYHDRLVLVTISEFGRRLRSNKSNGTDHGHAGAMLVLGGRVNGGRMYGKWPGLATPALDRAVDLAVTTDYRAVLAAVAGSGLPSQRVAQLFPGYAPGSPLPILRI